MHYVVDYVSFGTSIAITTFRLLLVSVTVVSIVGVHINLTAVRLIKLLRCTEVLDI